MSLETRFQQPHREAVAFLRGKPAVSREVFDQLLPELRARAFTVAGIEMANVLEDLREQIAALPEGKPWDEVKTNVADALERQHFSREAAERRAELLLRIHGFQAFQAATWRAAQLDEDTTHLQYLTMEDDRVRPAHRALDGVVLPKDDPFWDTHTPPWDWGCRCRIRPLNPDQVALVRAQDQGKPPEARLVMDGPVLDQLRHGTRITPDGQRVDVTPPGQRPGGEKAFQWHPDSMTLHWRRLQERYDPKTWQAFEQWAMRTKLPADGRTVKQWLAGFDGITEALEWANGNLPQVVDMSLRSAQKDALRRYQQSGDMLNRRIWSGQLTAGDLEMMERLDAALEGSRPHHQLTVFRSIQRKWIADLKVGDVWQHKGYMSTTLARERAEFWVYQGAPAQRAILEIVVPSRSSLYLGTLAGSEYRSEVEVLLPRAARLKIVDIAQDARGWQIIRAQLL